MTARTADPRPPHAPRRTARTATPWAVLVASLLLTAAATLFVAAGTRARDEARFGSAVQDARDRIRGRIDVYLATLRAGAALFAADETISLPEFRRFVDRLDLQRHYPGIQGIGWSERVARDLPGTVDERHRIEYLEPLDRRNEVAVGFDMYGEPVRRAAMRQARDRAQPALSGRVTLVQEIDERKQAGFLIYLPVYRGGEIPDSVAARRRLLRGFVYAPFRADDLFDGIFGSAAAEPRVAVRVYDGGEPRPSRLLHASPAAEGHDPDFRRTLRLRVAGRVWTVEVLSQPAFEAGSGSGLVPATLLAGLLASGLLFALALRESRARAAAEEANLAKSRFLATMSHELRTPLNAIGGYVELLEMGVRGPVNEAQREDLRRIKRAERHLLGLINDVLNFARLEAGRVEFRAEPVRLERTVAEAEALLGPQLEERGLRYRRADGDPEAVVLADPEKLRQIVLNLLSNAVKFTEPGGEVSVAWAARDAAVDLRVRDTGVGIPPERLASIFEPFVQVDGDLTRVRQGTGLGLAIGRELARSMGGDLRAESAPGEGSVFTLSLPVPPRDGEGEGEGTPGGG